MVHSVDWHVARPLWGRALSDSGARARFRQPALLRFAADTFMDDLLALLADDPDRLSEVVARPETWREPGVGWLTEAQAASITLPRAWPKLFQAVHQRFYLVTASLICRIPGLPDKRLDPAAGEKASFLLRRLVPVNSAAGVDPSDPDTWTEYGWMTGESPAWRAITSGDGVEAEEERQALFPLSYANGSKTCRLLAGFIPVGSGESYKSGAGGPLDFSAAEAAASGMSTDPRVAAVATRVDLALQRFSDDVGAMTDPSDVSADTAWQVVLFAALDLAEAIQADLPSLWLALTAGSSSGLGSALLSLYTRLSTQLLSTPSDTWRELVVAVNAVATELVEGELDLGLFVPPLIGGAAHARSNAVEAADSLFAGIGVADMYADALDEGGSGDPADSAPDVAVPRYEPGVYYVIRCIYERPRCAGIHPPIISDATVPFEIAGYFDPEAPARPLQITMPLDTSIGGLRKFPKGVSVLISEELRKQLERFEGLKLSKLDEGDIGGAGGASFGMICSLSIPIITIVALILLMIFVFLLNIIFWWVPLLKICFPLKLSAK